MVASTTKVKVRSFAKLNLTFEILGALPVGYHEVRTMFQSIDLADELVFELRKKGVTFGAGSSSRSQEADDSVAPAPEVTERLRIAIVRDGESAVSATESNYSAQSFPLDGSNLIAKAARRFSDETGFGTGSELLVHVKKNIPVAAGLAGGSGNAAATLTALAWFFPGGKAALQSIASDLGSDINFCLIGGSQIGSNRGELLEPVQHEMKLFFVIVKPRDVAISTPWIYKQYDEYMQSGRLHRPDIDFTHELAKSLIRRDVEHLNRSVFNEFECICFDHFPQVKILKEQMLDAGCCSAGITGSGPTLFGLVPSIEAGHAVRRKLISMNTVDGANRTAAKDNQSKTSLTGVPSCTAPLEFDCWFAQSTTRGVDMTSTSS